MKLFLILILLFVLIYGNTCLCNFPNATTCHKRSQSDAWRATLELVSSTLTADARAGQASCRDESKVSVRLAQCPRLAHTAQCAHGLQQQHARSAPCATSQMKDQTSMFTMGSQSKLLITVNLMFSSWELTPRVLQLNCVFSVKGFRCFFFF